MVDTRGRKHLVTQITDLTGEANWCSRKFIATRNAYSKSWLQVDIKGWTLVSMMTE